MLLAWRICKHVGEFESFYLADLEGGKLSLNDWYCGVEGELCINLDGDISPVCLNILPLASSSLKFFLHIFFYYLLLTNRGSPGGIDALLGCLLHLPSSNYFSGTTWMSLTGKQ